MGTQLRIRIRIVHIHNRVFRFKTFSNVWGDNVTVKAPLSATLKRRGTKILKRRERKKKRRIRSDFRFEGQDRNMYSSDAFFLCSLPAEAFTWTFVCRI